MLNQTLAVTITIGLIGIFVIIFIYHFIWKHWWYFTDRGIKFVRGIPVLGTNYKMLLGQEAVGLAFQRLYKKFPTESLIGIYDAGGIPAYLIRDPELIKQIAIRDFDNFLNHRGFVDEHVDPLMAKNLFFLKNEQWKSMRSTLSPAFTGSKIRLMFPLMVKCCQNFVESLNKMDNIATTTGADTIYEMKDIFSRYTMDTIGSCAFGLEVNSLQERNNEFYETGKSITDLNKTSVLLKLFGFSVCPKLMSFFKLRLVSHKNEQYFHDTVRRTINYRKKNNVIRQDMVNLLLQASCGLLEHSNDAGNEKYDTTGFSTATESYIDFTDKDIVAQCLVFFIAGFDTVSTLLSFLSHELAVNPDVQERLYQEIIATNQRLEGETITYEALQSMKYLDMCLSETLRKWPAAGAVDRICTKPCTLEYMNIKIQLNVGDGFIIPIHALHHDPEYFPEPNRFNPERFNEENCCRIPGAVYMPFGIGPRNCVGSRFAIMECKVIFYQMLKEFRLDKCQQTQNPLKFGKGFTAISEKGVWLKLTRRQNK